MSFTARYGGRCLTCDERIVPGHEVEYDDDDNLVHEKCLGILPLESRRRVDFDDDPDLTPGESCPECFTIKAVNGACSCP